jgi:hypothetical protein
MLWHRIARNVYAKHFIIAAFLSGGNTNNWLQAEMEVMMKSHLDVMLEESSARLNGDWAADDTVHDKVHQQILEMAGKLGQTSPQPVEKDLFAQVRQLYLLRL